jgi:diguanylate cyclase (GGDEF)-like protein
MSETLKPVARVLIVDDSRMVRASIIKHIRDRYEFREEGDGEAGWQALMVDPSIHVVISDIGMPRLDGYGLLDRIRNSRVARLRSIPVIIISGDEDDDARERARSLGANDFITKGIGTSELLARLDTLCKLALANQQLEESRTALAEQKPVDTSTGLATASYLDTHGEQELALARRHQGDLSVMVIEIDRYTELTARYGTHVVQLIGRKLSKILSSRVRREDTVAELASGQFAVLSPNTDLDSCCAFALRMQKAIEKAVMTYRDERIRISVTAGIACSTVDSGSGSVSQLIELAAERCRAGREAGGNRVMANRGEVGTEAIERALKMQVSVDQALMQLRIGGAAEVRPRMPELIRTLMPLFELIESESRCGIPLASLARQASGGVDGDHPTGNS